MDRPVALSRSRCRERRLNSLVFSAAWGGWGDLILFAACQLRSVRLWLYRA